MPRKIKTALSDYSLTEYRNLLKRWTKDNLIKQLARYEVYEIKLNPSIKMWTQHATRIESEGYTKAQLIDKIIEKERRNRDGN